MSRSLVTAVRAWVPADRAMVESPQPPAPPPPADADVPWGRRPIASPLSRYAGHDVRTVGGPDWPGNVIVEVESSCGAVGIGASVGGAAASWIVEQHLAQFVVGRDPRSVETIWDQMYRGTLFYGRKGVVVHAISAVDLALWDLLGKLADRPVYELIGGPAREAVACYATTPNAAAAREGGYIGCKLPLPYGPAAGPDRMRENVERFAAARADVGDELFLAYDCWMSLDVESAVQLAHDLEPHRPAWLEESLPPDDYAGYARLRQRIPRSVAVAAGEHEATRWGFRTLTAVGQVDFVQPDPAWCGGLTELLKIIAEAEAAGVRLVPHGSSPYALHAVFARASIPFAESLLASPAGDEPAPSFRGLLGHEPLPRAGRFTLEQISGPGFGLQLAADAALVRPTMREEVSHAR